MTAAPATAVRTLTIEQRLLRLTDFGSTQVVIDAFPRDLLGQYSGSSIKEYVTNRLEKLGVEVLDDAEIERAYMRADMGHDAAALKAHDRMMSAFCVRVRLVAAGDEALSVVTVHVRRGAFFWPGDFGSPIFWEDSDFSELDISGLDLSARADLLSPKSVARRQLDLLLDSFEKDWKLCNPD